LPFARYANINSDIRGADLIAANFVSNDSTTNESPHTHKTTNIETIAAALNETSNEAANEASHP
jgi:hypothetical protein